MSDIHGTREELVAMIVSQQQEINQLQAKMHCMCGSPMDHSAWEGHTPVSMYDHALDSANEEIERLRERCQAYKGQVEAGADKIERLRAVLLQVPCPAGGWTGMPKELEGQCTVADCLKDKSCGCIFGGALSPHEPSGAV